MDEPTPAEEVVHGPAAIGSPVFTMDTETGQVTVTWPHGMPSAVLMSPDMLQEWVDDRNGMVARIKQLEEVLATMRLGRRPSAEFWKGLNLPPVPREDRVDLMRRKIPTQGGSNEDRSAD